MESAYRVMMNNIVRGKYRFNQTDIDFMLDLKDAFNEVNTHQFLPWYEEAIAKVDNSEVFQYTKILDEFVIGLRQYYKYKLEE